MYHLMSQNPEKKLIFEQIIDRVNTRIKDAKSLKNYSEQPVLERERKSYKKLEELSEKDLMVKKIKQILEPNNDMDEVEYRRNFSAEQ